MIGLPARPQRRPLARGGLARPGSGCGPGPSALAPPDPKFEFLVDGSSQLPRLDTGRAAVTNGHKHRILC